MVNATLARRYALAAAMLARQRDVAEATGRDLVAIAKAIGERGTVHEFFVAPVVDRGEKERLLARCFAGRVDEVALHLLLLLVRKRRETLLQAIVREYLALERAARNAETLTLSTARPLDRDEYRRLIERLERIYGKRFEVRERVDPNLIGGARILMGDRRIDATVAGRLDNLARELAAR